MRTYPLTAIVTSSPSLTNAYNGNLGSAYLLSECISPEYFAKLLQDNAVFDAIVLVDGAGQNLIPTIGARYNWNAELMPKIENFDMPSLTALEAVDQLHHLIRKSPESVGMG